MLSYLIYSVSLFYITLILYLAIMHIARFKDTITKEQKILFFPIVLVGIVADVLFRYTVGIILKLPNFTNDDLLFTSVLQDLMDDNTWKGSVARFMCRTLDMFDPKGKHC